MQNQTVIRQFRLWTALLVLVPSLLVMVIYTVGQIKSAKQENLQLMSQRVHSQERLIDYWMMERTDDVRKLSQSGDFATLDEEQMKHALTVMQQNNKNFDSLSYINKDGFLKVSTLRSEIKYPSVVDQPYFQVALGGKEYISDVVTGRNSGLPIINVSSPVFDYAGNFQGLILGSVKTTTLETLLRDNWFGVTGEVYLVNREGTLLTEPRYVNRLLNKGLIEDTAVMNLKLTDDALRNIHLGQSGTATWTDYLGNKGSRGLLGRARARLDVDWQE